MDLRPFEKKVWLSSPTMHGEELKYITEAYETNWMSTVGENINETENLICKKIGCQYSVALSAGTAALHMAVKLAGVKRGEHVFCSDMTFDATVNPIVYEGGIPVFIDTEYETWNMDPAALEKAFELYPDVKTVVLVHLYGTPGKIDEIREICSQHGAILIEDSEHARRYLADCGLPKERTYVTGSPMAEVLHDNLEKIEASDVHARLGLEKGKYILLSAHREENIDTEKNFLSLFEAINKIAEKYDMPILYSCHPRSRKRLEASGFQLDQRVIQHEPLGFHDYNCLQMNAFAVVSDSGTLPEESSFFTSVGHPFPAVCIRTSTERPEALDKGCFVLAGIDSNSLVQAVETAVAMNENGDYGIPVPDYVEENVSTKVVKIIQSYTGVVNKMVWRKF